VQGKGCNKKQHEEILNPLLLPNDAHNVKKTQSY